MIELDTLDYLFISNKNPEDFPDYQLVESCTELDPRLNGVFVFYEKADSLDMYDSIVSEGTLNSMHCGLLFKRKPLSALNILLRKEDFYYFTELFVEKYGSIEGIFQYLNKDELDKRAMLENERFSKKPDVGDSGEPLAKENEALDGESLVNVGAADESLAKEDEVQEDDLRETPEQSLVIEGEGNQHNLSVSQKEMQDLDESTAVKDSNETSEQSTEELKPQTAEQSTEELEQSTERQSTEESPEQSTENLEQSTKEQSTEVLEQPTEEQSTEDLEHPTEETPEQSSSENPTNKALEDKAIDLIALRLFGNLKELIVEHDLKQYSETQKDFEDTVQTIVEMVYSNVSNNLGDIVKKSVEDVYSRLREEAGPEHEDLDEEKLKSILQDILKVYFTDNYSNNYLEKLLDCVLDIQESCKLYNEKLSEDLGTLRKNIEPKLNNVADKLEGLDRRFDDFDSKTSVLQKGVDTETDIVLRSAEYLLKIREELNDISALVEKLQTQFSDAFAVEDDLI